jgi:peptide deformylase
MAVRPLRILGEPGDAVLRQPAAAVERIDGSVQMLIDDMLDTMRDAPGVGLAAPQLGVSLRIVVVEVPEVPAFALINPAVVRHSGQRLVEEGCLSIPGYRGDLQRSIRVTVKGLDRQGRLVRVRATDDLLAQVLEHEIDHTHGLLYVDLLAGPEHLHRLDRTADDDGEPQEPRPLEATAAQRRRRRGVTPILVRAPRRSAGARTPGRSR